MTEDGSNAILVRAKYTFKGKNNDELTFTKGNVITITQKLDGGWWEGTLNGNTGWFPSDYVVEIKPSDKPLPRSKSPVNGTTTKGASDGTALVSPPNQEAANRNLYRNMILRNMLESERKHVRELTQLLDSHLRPLRTEATLPEDEYRCLVGNLEQVLQFQTLFLNTLEDQVKAVQYKDQRIGGEFMRSAPTLKTLLTIYCENHPAAVEVLNKKRDPLTSFVQKRGADLMALVTGLSRPFRHLEMYPATLQELERNIDESHPDRGDTQRAIAVYRDIAKVAADIRKQKEMQLELLSGMISGWDGEPISTMGDIIYMGTVQVMVEDGEKEDCCLVLLTGVLLVLQISFQLNTYIFKRKILLDGACVRKFSEVKLNSGAVFVHVLEIQPSTASNANSTPVVMLYQNGDELNKWLELFQSVEGVNLDDSCATISPSTPLQYSTVQTSASPLMKPQVSTLPSPGHAKFVKNQGSGNVMTSSWQNGGSIALTSSVDGLRHPRSGCFRPLPPQRISPAAPNANSGKANVKLRKKELIDHVFDEEETDLLKVVESYCLSERTRPPAATKRNVDSPHLIVAEDEKIFVEELVGDEIVVQERTLVDTVYTLKDQIATLREEVKTLSKLLEAEQKARRRIEETLRKHVGLQSSASSSAISKPQPNENGFTASASVPPQ